MGAMREFLQVGEWMRKFLTGWGDSPIPPLGKPLPSCYHKWKKLFKAKNCWELKLIVNWNSFSKVTYQVGFNQRTLTECFYHVSVFLCSYCVDVSQSKQNHHINCLHERALRIVYKDHNSSFDDFFWKR